MSKSSSGIKLRVPHQDLDAPSAFDANEQALAGWINALPKANIGQTTRLLYQAIAELNRTRLLPEKRLTLLEMLRPHLHLVCRSLSKHFLNQPIVIPEQAARVAKLAHTLNQQLAEGYNIVSAQVAAMGLRTGARHPDDTVALALQRAITEYSLINVRHFQLYEQEGEPEWRTLNQLLKLAIQKRVLRKPVADSEYGEVSVEAAYLRAALIHCAKPNQLRQEDIMAMFRPLAHWTSLCSISGADDGSLFAVDPDAAAPPVYRELVASVVDDNWLGINTRGLTHHLKSLRDNSGSQMQVHDGHHAISTDLLGHLILAWSRMSKRVFMRMESDEALELSLGLSNTHHFISGGMTLEALTSERGARTFSLQQENPFLRSNQQVQVHRPKDVWDSAYDTNVGQTKISLESIDYYIKRNEEQAAAADAGKSKYRSHHVRTINSSSHGYCIEWPSDLIEQVKAGEIIGIRNENQRVWSIGVIRWVNRDTESHIQIGIELLSPSASPYGARVVQKVGELPDFSRVLVLPEAPALKRPYTLLTPRLPFKEGQKVMLNQRGKELQIVLTKKLNETGAYNLFEFQKSGKFGTGITPSSQDGDSFDSLWSSL